jgi:hypothetical protein
LDEENSEINIIKENIKATSVKISSACIDGKMTE